MPDERPDDPAPGGWLPPTGGDEPITPAAPTPSAAEGWLPPTDADYTPPEPDAYPAPAPGQASSWPGQAAPPAPYGGSTGGLESLGKATASLALSVVGLFLCPIIFSVAGIVLGQQARREIDAEPRRYGNRGQAQWGVNLGWVGLAFGILLIALIAAGMDITPSGDDS